MVIDDSPSWTEQLGNGLLNLTMDSHRIGARNSPKQAKNEIIQQKVYSVNLRLYLSWDLSVLSWDREIELKTVSLKTKSWDLRGLKVSISKFLFSYLILHITQWTSTKEKCDLDKMQSFLEVLKTFKFAAILVYHSHQSFPGLERVVT